MPAYEAMFGELMNAFRSEELKAQARSLIGDGKSLVEVLKELSLLANPGQEAFIAQTPASIQSAILAAVGQNLQRDQPKQMLFTWTAGYDWEMRLAESTSTDISAGGITIHVKSRYPGDPHPGTGT